MDYSRNLFFISTEIQKELATKTLLICGSGMGSLIAEMAIRTGFQKIIIADGDQVDLSNLNRQNFTNINIGENKAFALKERLLKINPQLEIECIEKYLIYDDLKLLISKSDFIINTIDFDSDAFLDCHKLCVKKKKIELFPINLGFGGGLIITQEGSPSWSNYFQTVNSGKLKGHLLNHIFKNGEFSQYSKGKFLEYQQRSFEHDPQMATATLSCSNLVLTALVQLCAGLQVKKFPEIIIHDPLLDVLDRNINELEVA